MRRSICPGRIATGRLSTVFAGGGEVDRAKLADLEREIPVGRVGTPEEIAGKETVSAPALSDSTKASKREKS